MTEMSVVPKRARKVGQSRPILSIVLLGAVLFVAALAIYGLQRGVQSSRELVASMGDLHATNLRLSALEWEMMARHEASQEMRTDLDGTFRHAEQLLRRIGRHEDANSKLKGLLRNQRNYTAAIRRQARAVAEGRMDEAARLDEALTDPIFKLIYAEMLEIVGTETAWIEQRQTTANIASAAVLIACFALTALLMLVNFESIRRRVESQESLSSAYLRERYLMRLMENSGEILMLIDEQARILFAGGAIGRLITLRQEQLIGRKISEFCHPEDLPRAQAVLEQSRAQPGIAREQRFRARATTDHWRHFEVTVTNLLQDALVAGILLNVRDITQKLRSEERLQEMAYRDQVTGLPNRSQLMQSLENRITSFKKDDAFAVFFIDLDNFKYVNDSFGHQAGDLLLAAVGKRLESTVRGADVLARWGGDEFVLLIESTGEAARLSEIAERLLIGLAKPFELLDQEIVVGATIGISIFDDASDMDAEAMLKQADHALYRGKARRKGSYHFYGSRSIPDRLSTPRLRMLTDLHRAIERGEIEVHYQPIVSLDRVRTERAEALMRWRHRERGVVPCDEFLALAEESALIEHLGREVLRRSVSDLARWRARGILPARFSLHLNFSPRELRAPGFVAMIADVLREHDVPPAMLCMEITERSLLDPSAADAEWMTELTALGSKLCLDDFGTGYSSLSNLHQFPLSGLKVDRSFISRLPGDPSATAILDAIRSMADAFSLELVAEGVETEVQRHHLRALHYTHGQGFLFAAALPADEFEARYLAATADASR